MSELGFLVITVSDTCADNASHDRSGPALKEKLLELFPSCRVENVISPDEKEKIENILISGCDNSVYHGIFTTGGTGFAPRDVTPEATRNVIEKEAPQLAQAMLISSLHITPMACLSRAVCGVRKDTLIVNLPGSPKAVKECLDAISRVLPHVISLLRNDSKTVTRDHRDIQKGCDCSKNDFPGGRVSERASKYPMMELQAALEAVFKVASSYRKSCPVVRSPLNVPPFRASIKDGYAVKSSGGGGKKRVLGSVSAGIPTVNEDFSPDACFKINTGAPVPRHADAIVQVEDTKLLEVDGNQEVLIEIMTMPEKNCDIREIGCDIAKDEVLFTCEPPLCAGKLALAASIGLTLPHETPIKIAIVSTGDEIVTSGGELRDGQIYDSNTPMLKKLLEDFGFHVNCMEIARDTFDDLKETLERIFEQNSFVICSGGVSMGDRDFVKAVLKEMNMEILFGRVNMKPGKPLTFACKKSEGKMFFGLPGNPVSTFVTFHLLVLPALRFASNHPEAKCGLPVIKLKIAENIQLDPRPEFMRATVKSINGELWASITGNQMSSNLKSVIGADVLLHIPIRTTAKTSISKGTVVNATILKQDFVSEIL